MRLIAVLKFSKAPTGIVLLLCALLYCSAPVFGAPSPQLIDNRPAPPLPAFTPAIAPPVPARYTGLTVKEMAAREYGGGQLRIESTLSAGATFTRTLISYPSDGLRIYGFMNTPVGEGPFPVIILNHGYVNPTHYTTLTYTTRYADALARAGFIAIHPNFRNYPPSDPGPNEFRSGYAADVLNLAALVREWGGREGPLALADASAIGLWGHSMGGGVSLRSIVLDPHIRAALLYGSMSGDEARNHDRILFFTGGANGLWEDDTAPDATDLRRISPINHLQNINAAVSIHHGEFDEQVPLFWSEELCDLLQAAGKSVECFVYAGMPHTFYGDGDSTFIQRSIAFFDRELRTE